MKLKRKCKICGKSFTAIKNTQFFCQRKCFKKDYYQRTKKKLAELEARRPTFTCAVCDTTTKLDFDPIKDEVSFGLLICTNCGIPRRVALKESDNPHFVLGDPYIEQFIIRTAIVVSPSAPQGQ
jgi:transcription elongation factor Elf1